jgi:hypothetical protein
MGLRLRQRLWRDRMARQEARDLRLDLEYDFSFLDGHSSSHSEFLINLYISTGSGRILDQFILDRLIDL